MSQKENVDEPIINNGQNINEINKPKKEEIKLKNLDNNTLIYSDLSTKSRKINDNIIYNLLNHNNNNNREPQLKISQTTNLGSIENVKQDIINFYLIEQKKTEEKKREIEINRNMNINLNMYLKKDRNSNKPKEKNRFEKYDKEKLSYEIYHQYQKLSFEKEKLPFVQRMQLYALKKSFRDYKIEELTNIKSPKISEKKIINTFNRLIEDSNRRNLKLLKNNSNSNQNNNNIQKKNNNIKNKNIAKNKANQNKEFIKDKNNNNVNNKSNDNLNNNKNNPNNNVIKKKPIYKTNKSFDKQKWDEIYERRFSSKLKERNEKLEKMRQEKEEKIKKEEDTIIDNLNKKQILINQKYGMKRSHSVNDITKDKNKRYNSISNKYYIGNNSMINIINQRLYYNEVNKKDIDYQTFMEKAQELLNDNNNDYFYYYGKEEIKNNCKNEGKKNAKKNNIFRTCTALAKNKKITKSNSVYNFRELSESDRDIESKKDEENKKYNYIRIKQNSKNVDNGTNFQNHKFNGIKIDGSNNYINNTKSDFLDLVNCNSINNKEKNSSAEIIIDRFFEG